MALQRAMILWNYLQALHQFRTVAFSLINIKFQFGKIINKYVNQFLLEVCDCLIMLVLRWIYRTLANSIVTL